MANDETVRLLNEIGQVLAQDTKYPLNGTLLYAKLDTNMVSAAIFKELGDHVLYRWSHGKLMNPLLDLWEEEPKGKRWAEMEYVIRDGRFTVTYTYPDEIDQGEDPFDRRDRIVKRHFGDKPIVYPPLRDDDDGQVFEL